MKSSATSKTIIEKVEDALQIIRPYLEADGGDVKILDINKEGVVTLELLGACGSCPYSLMTLKNGVETAVKKAIPEIKSVESINT